VSLGVCELPEEGAPQQLPDGRQRESLFPGRLLLQVQRPERQQQKHERDQRAGQQRLAEVRFRNLSPKNPESSQSAILRNQKKSRKPCASNALEMRGPPEDPLFFRASKPVEQDRGLSNDVAVLMNP